MDHNCTSSISITCLQVNTCRPHFVFGKLSKALFPNSTKSNPQNECVNIVPNNKHKICPSQDSTSLVHVNFNSSPPSPSVSCPVLCFVLNPLLSIRVSVTHSLTCPYRVIFSRFHHASPTDNRPTHITCVWTRILVSHPTHRCVIP